MDTDGVAGTLLNELNDNRYQVQKLNKLVKEQVNILNQQVDSNSKIMENDKCVSKKYNCMVRPYFASGSIRLQSLTIIKKIKN